MSDYFKHLLKPPGRQIPSISVREGTSPSCTLQLGDLGPVISPLRKLMGFFISTTWPLDEDTSKEACYALTAGKDST